MRVERSNGVAWIILSRPSQLNALDTQTLRRARDALREACQSGEERVVAISGEGRLFSAGIDLVEVSEAKSPSEAQRPFRALRMLIDEMLSCKKPVVAVLNGPAVAGGAEVALAADITYAVRGAFLQWPELRWGLIPPVLASLVRSRPGQRLAGLLLAMDRIPVEEAVSLGLVSRVFDDLEAAKKAVEELAATLGGAGKTAVVLALETVRTGKREGAELYRELERLAGSEELVRKAREFVESRRRG